VDDQLRHPLLLELIHAELENRLRKGPACKVEEYLSRFPELEQDRQLCVDLIHAEYAAMRRQCPDLTLRSYVRRFPAFSEDLLHVVASTCIVPTQPLRKNRFLLKVVAGPHNGLRCEFSNGDSILAGHLV